MPAGNDARGEIDPHDRVHRHHQRRGQSGENSVRHVITMPVHCRAPPTHRQKAVDPTADATLGPVAQGSQIGDQTDVPEHQRDRRIRRNREHVPHQRAAELRPDVHRVRIRQQPIKHPDAAQMQQRKQGSASDREQGHGLGKAVDTGSPLLIEQQQDRGDQCAGVSDSDPPHEVNDVEAPPNWDVDAPDSNSCRDQVADRIEHHHYDQERNAEAQPPAARRSAGEYDRADLVGDRREVVSRAKKCARAGGVFRVGERRCPSISSDPGADCAIVPDT